MGISVGILALICALVLLFGVRGTRRLLGWSLGLIILGAVGLAAVVWIWPMLPPPFNPPAAKLLSDADVGLPPNSGTAPSTQSSQWWQNDPVAAPRAPPFDPSKPYEVVWPPSAVTGVSVAELDQQIDRTNTLTPITLDAITKIKHVSRVEHLITFEYEVALPADKWTDAHRNDVRRIATKANCIDDKETQKMLGAGFNVRHVFLDQTGIVAYSVVITKNSC